MCAGYMYLGYFGKLFRYTAAHLNHITKLVSILYTYTVINNYFLFLQSLNRYY